MKKTLKLVLALMLALFVFVSCENKAPEEPKEKTLQDYLAGKSIYVSVEMIFDDDDSIDYDDGGKGLHLMSLEDKYYLSLPISFDKDLKISSKSASIVDCEGTIDGLVYKTSFKDAYEMWNDENEEYEIVYELYELEFKVINESKVIVSGSYQSYDAEEAIQLKETEATISGDLPSWFTSGDWVYIPDANDDSSLSSYNFAIFDEELPYTYMGLGLYYPEQKSIAVSSKGDVASFSMVESDDDPEYKYESNMTYDFTKVSEEAAKVSFTYQNKYKDLINKIEDGYFSKFNALLKKIDKVPEWLMASMN